MIKHLGFGPILFPLLHAAFASSITPGDVEAARSYFAEARAIAERDDGKLWGHRFNAAILFVDPKTREAIASEPDGQGKLTAASGVFVGTIPANVLVANTALEWAGVKWTMLLLPLPKDSQHRATLLAHEMWHRIQDAIGFPSSGAANQHLDSRKGRLWLQLEWRALSDALTRHGEERASAARDALIFRDYRRLFFDNAAEEERAMEMHEGLAEYTGVVLNGSADAACYVAENELKDAPAKSTFVRSFAYASGPAYGVLLDSAASDWRTKLTKTDDLGVLLQRAFGIQLPSDLRAAAEDRASQYGGAELSRAEAEREQVRQKRIAEQHATFIDGPVVNLPLRHMQMQFDPGELMPLENRGTVYPTIKVSDEWGTLTASKGALLASDFTRVTVSAPPKSDAPPTKGDGWILELKRGWELRRDKRAGDWLLEQK